MTDRATFLKAAAVIAFLGAFPANAARGRTPETPELDAEREKLIEKILRGETFEQSVAAFAALVQKRDPIIPTSARAQKARREQLDTKYAWQAEWKKTADSEVAWRCRLGVDPANMPRPPGSSGVPDWEGDWGVITRKEQIRKAPKNDLDEGELVTVYEMKGQRRTYRFPAENFGIFKQRRFEAQKGDFILLCDGGTDTERDLPEPWSKEFQRSGFAVKLKSPPRITKKRRWDPLQITDNALFWAVRDVKWRFGEGKYVLCVIDVAEDQGNGRYLIDVDIADGVQILVDVPPNVANRKLMVPGQKVWAILGNARFDKTVRKLVLTVEDLEDRYIDEVPLSEEDLAGR